jgi:chromosome partitioning protein
MKIIAIANPAGGVGKSTLAHSLAVGAAEFGKKTLLIDLDPGAGLTFQLGYENSRLSITDFLISGSITEEDLFTTDERFDFIPTDSRLMVNFGQDVLKDVLKNLDKKYDLVILDCPPSITPSLAMALSAADYIFTPVMENIHSLRGLLQLRKMTNLLVTAVAIGSVTFQEIKPVLDSNIDFYPDIQATVISNLSVLTIDKNSSIAEDYRNATYSVLELIGLE